MGNPLIVCFGKLHSKHTNVHIMLVLTHYVTFSRIQYSILHLFQTLVRSAVQGIVIGIVVASPILILATHNFLVGLWASAIIMFITTCVIGFIPMMGWKLGVSWQHN